MRHQPSDNAFDAACSFLECEGSICTQDQAVQAADPGCVPACAELFGDCCDSDSTCTLGDGSGGNEITEVNCSDEVDDDGDGDTDCDDSDCDSDPGCGGLGGSGDVPENAVICDAFDVCLSIQYGISGQNNYFDFVNDWEDGDNTYDGWISCVQDVVGPNYGPVILEIVNVLL